MIDESCVQAKENTSLSHFQEFLFMVRKIVVHQFPSFYYL